MRTASGQDRVARGVDRLPPVTTLLGLLTLVASVLYFGSDVVEALQGGFSAGQLWLTLLAEAAIPIFVIGLAAAQRPRLGRLGVLAAVGYAYSYVVFTGTVVYALVNDTKNYEELTDQLGAVMTVHGAVMVVAGLGFGHAVLRARTLPAWTALALMAGVVLVAVTQTLPEGAQLAAAGVRDLGFAGMGAAMLRTPAGRTRSRSHTSNFGGQEPAATGKIRPSHGRQRT